MFAVNRPVRARAVGDERLPLRCRDPPAAKPCIRDASRTNRPPRCWRSFRGGAVSALWPTCVRRGFRCRIRRRKQTHSPVFPRCFPLFSRPVRRAWRSRKPPSRRPAIRETQASDRCRRPRFPSTTPARPCLLSNAPCGRTFAVGRSGRGVDAARRPASPRRVRERRPWDSPPCVRPAAWRETPRPATRVRYGNPRRSGSSPDARACRSDRHPPVHATPRQPADNYRGSPRPTRFSQGFSALRSRAADAPIGRPEGKKSRRQREQ